MLLSYLACQAAHLPRRHVAHQAAAAIELIEIERRRSPAGSPHQHVLRSTLVDDDGFSLPPRRSTTNKGVSETSNEVNKLRRRRPAARLPRNPAVLALGVEFIEVRDGNERRATRCGAARREHRQRGAARPAALEPPENDTFEARRLEQRGEERGRPGRGGAVASTRVERHLGSAARRRRLWAATTSALAVT